MTLQPPGQLPLSLQNGSKMDMRTQFAALCYRMVKDKPEILLITSRRSRRWIIPKGWPMDGRTPIECALLEAWEEAGVRGRVTGGCMGLYSYHKMIGPERGLPCAALIYPVRVLSLAQKYPEAGQRKRKWLRPRKAARKIDEAELAHVVRNLDPRRLNF